MPAALLPDSFAGWVAADTLRTVTDPAQADPANTAALKEYDFTDGMLAAYKRDGETLSLRALRFHDASGAYGAYSFYRQNGWPKEEIGTGATSNHNRVLFWMGEHGGGRELLPHRPHVWRGAARVGQPVARARRIQGAGSAHPGRSAPGLAGRRKPRTMRWDRRAMRDAGGVLPPDLVGFDRGAEAVTANYSLRSGPATLTIIDYPTPQMAAAQETKIRAYIKAGEPGPAGLAQAASGFRPGVARGAPQRPAGGAGQRRRHSRRKPQAAGHGPLRGRHDVHAAARRRVRGGKDGQAADGHRGTRHHRRQRRPPAGFFLGGGRALYRIARGKPVSSVYEEEFIRIDLREEWVESTTGG